MGGKKSASEASGDVVWGVKGGGTWTAGDIVCEE